MPIEPLYEFDSLEVDMEPVKVTGKVIFTSRSASAYVKPLKGKYFRSKPMTNPTWDKVLATAQEALKFTGDSEGDHVALTGLVLIETEKDGTEVYEFNFDS